MPSFGETDILINSTGVGVLSVSSIAPGTAIFPRLNITIGYLLRTSSGGPPGPRYSDFELRDLRGELRLEERSHAIGRIEWAADKQIVKSDGFERPLEMLCDLDAQTLEAVERRRNGKEPVFYIQLWPTIVGSSESYRSECRSLRMSVPRDRWMEVLSAIGRNDQIIVEVDLSKDDKGEFRRACEHVQKAREQIDKGDFDNSAISCRRAIDAVTNVFPPAKEKEDPIKGFVESALNEHRVAAYAAAASVVRRFGGSAAHDYDPIPLSRAEARLVLSTTANLIAALVELQRTEK
jgi:hypothetical protein